MKKLLCFFFVFFVMFSMPALAQEIDVNDNPIEAVELDLSGSPRFAYLGHITIGININDNGYLTYTGAARTFGYDLRIKLYLQRSTNGLIWEDLESYVKTGYEYVLSSGSRYVQPGDYFYRAKIIAEVLDSNRNVIETATAYSSEERY